MPLLLIYLKIYSLGGINPLLQALFLMSPPVCTNIIALFPVLALHRSWEFIQTPYSVPGNVMRKKADRTYTLVILSRTWWRKEYLWNVSVQEIHILQQKITFCEFQQHFKSGTGKDFSSCLDLFCPK